MIIWYLLNSYVTFRLIIISLSKVFRTLNGNIMQTLLFEGVIWFWRLDEPCLIVFFVLNVGF